MSLCERVARTEVRPGRNPAQLARQSALVYVACCLFYIWLSGLVAGRIAADADQLRFIEWIKGSLFVVVTGLLFYFISHVWWCRIRAREELIQKQQQALRQSESRAVAAMFAASVAHDLDNLLQMLAGLMESMKEHDGDAYQRALRREVEAATQKLSALSRRMTSTMKQVVPDDRKLVDIGHLMEQTVTLARKHPALRQGVLDVEANGPVFARVDPVLLEEAVINLILNAAQASGDRCRVHVRCRREGDEVHIQVGDNGPGVPENLRERIFDPCFTTKPSGSGLGLLAVTAFVDTHHGVVWVGSSELGGALFELSFPAGDEPVAAPAAPTSAPAG